MKIILFILIIFINIIENMAVIEDGGGESSQSKGKRPLENESPPTDQSHQTNKGKFAADELSKAATGGFINFDGTQNPPEIISSQKKPKLQKIVHQKKSEIIETNPADFKGLVQEFTDGTVSSEKRIRSQRKNIEQHQHRSDYVADENQEIVLDPNPLTFYDPKERIVRTWDHFPQWRWRQEQKQKQQQNLGQHSPTAGIVQQGSPLFLGNMEGNENDKPSKRRALNYKEIRRFHSEKDFEQWIKSSDWRIFRFNKGENVLYWCTYYRKKGYNKCKARLKVTRPATDTIIAEEADIPHYHEPIKPLVGQSKPMHP